MKLKFSRALALLSATTLLFLYVNCAPTFVSNSESNYTNSFTEGPRPGSAPEFGPGLKTFPSKVSRLLTPREYNNMINSTFDLDSNPSLDILPVDTIEIFNFREQGAHEASAPTFDSFQSSALEVVDFIISQTEELNQSLSCNTKNRACLDRYFSKVGSQLFRRQLTEEEKSPVLNLAMSHISETSDFYTGVKTVLVYSLMHPSFLYVWEIGDTASEKAFRLSNHELLARISFFIIGTGPSQSMINSIPSEPYTDAQLSEIVDTFFEDERARDTTDAFHGMWFGYQAVGETGREKMLRTETKALLNRVIFNKDEPWVEVLLKNQTYINKSLADDYKIPHDGSSGFNWVDYVNPMRKGLFAHATFLSGGLQGETNLTQRGYHIRKALFCGEIDTPPANVVVDDGFSTDDPNDCKIDVIKKTALNPSGSCYRCHRKMDTIALGLENFDNLGAYRAHETGRPECRIEEDGTLDRVGTFRGPAGLAELAVKSGEVENCLIRRVLEFGFKRRIFNREVRNFSSIFNTLEDEFGKHQSYKKLVKSIALSPAFRLKIPEAEKE